MENGNKPEEHQKKPRGWALEKHRGPKFGLERPVPVSPGRPRLSDSVREARQILKDAAPEMVQRIFELSKSKDDDIAIKAIKVGLDKILPNLEEIETHDERPLPEFREHDLTARLDRIRAANNGSSGNGHSEGTSVAI